MKGDPLPGSCDHGVREDNETHTANLRFELPPLNDHLPGRVWCYTHGQWVDLGTCCVRK